MLEQTFHATFDGVHKSRGKLPPFHFLSTNY